MPRLVILPPAARYLKRIKDPVRCPKTFLPGLIISRYLDCSNRYFPASNGNYLALPVTFMESSNLVSTSLKPARCSLILPG